MPDRFTRVFMTNPMPAIFFGHGNPLNALARKAYTEGWAAIGKSLVHYESLGRDAMLAAPTPDH
jgi:aromatic ring-opening dioxygenase catalytic subunit (LigB family)